MPTVTRRYTAYLTRSIKGWMVQQVRNASGHLLKTLPTEVSDYLLLPPGTSSGVMTEQDDLTPILQGHPGVRYLKGIWRVPFTVDVKVPVSKAQRLREAKAEGGRILRSLRHLLDFWHADDVRSLNRRVYKATECGASISVRTPDGVWHHNGQDWSGITAIDAFTVQTIVEGSDAEVDSPVFELPVAEVVLERWLDVMEDRATALWEEANAE